MRYILGMLVVLMGTSVSFAEPLTLNEVMESVCRINNGRGWGTGTCIAEDEKDYYILTNAHVVGGARTVNVEFFRWGYKTQPLPARVTWRRLQGTLDAAIVRVDKRYFGDYGPRIIPLAPEGYQVRSGDYIMAAGCPQARWVQGWEGRIIGNDRSRVLFGPPPVGGQSGTGIMVVMKDEDDEFHTRVGVLLAWSVSGRRGGGVSLDTLYNAINGRTTFDELPDDYLPVSENKMVPIFKDGICKVCGHKVACHTNRDGECLIDVNVKDTACGPGGCSPGRGGGSFNGGGNRRPDDGGRGGRGGVPPLGPGNNPFTQRPPSDGGGSGRNPFGGNIKNPFGDRTPPGSTNPGSPWPGGVKPPGSVSPGGPNLPGSDKIKKLEAEIEVLNGTIGDLEDEVQTLVAAKLVVDVDLDAFRKANGELDTKLVDVAERTNALEEHVNQVNASLSDVNIRLSASNEELAAKGGELIGLRSLLSNANTDLKVQVDVNNKLETDAIHSFDGVTAGNGAVFERTSFLAGGSMLTVGLLFLWRTIGRRRVDKRLDGVINKLEGRLGGRLDGHLDEIKDRVSGGLDKLVKRKIRGRGGRKTRDDDYDDDDEVDDTPRRRVRPFQRLRRRRQERRSRRSRGEDFQDDIYDHPNFQDPPDVGNYVPTEAPKLYPHPDAKYPYVDGTVPVTPVSYPNAYGPVPIGVPTWRSHSSDDVLRAIDEVVRRNSGDPSLRNAGTLVRQVLSEPRR